MTIERIDIVITEKGGKTVKRSLDDIADSSKKVDTDLRRLNKTAVVVGGAIGTALGGTAVMLFKGFKNAATQIKATAEASRQLGVGVENMSRLDFAARSADMTTGDLVSTIQSLQRVQAQAAKPNSEMNKLFKQMGINAVDSNGKLRDTEAVLRDVADLFQRMPDGTNKSTLALKLFGTENQKVIGLLNEGSRGLDAMAKKSDELGYTLSTETAKDVKAFYDELDSVKLQIEAMYRQALPGLMPHLKDFSALLNSQGFKDGFNALVQGAAQAIIWLVKFASTVGSVTKFVGEEMAARLNGPDALDTVRVQERIERLQDTMRGLDAAEKKGALAIFDKDFLNASEFTPADFVKPISEVRARLQGELDKEQNKLQFGVTFNAEAVAAEANRAAEQVAQQPAGVAPTIDWRTLGRGGPKGSETDKEARALERLQRQLDSMVGSINPVLNAQWDLARAQDVFNKSVDKGLITQQAANDYMAIYEERLKDQLDPLGAVHDKLEQQIRVAGMLNEERDQEMQLLSITEHLKRSSIVLTEEETEALREQLRVLQAVDRLAAAKERYAGMSSGRRQEQRGFDIEALRGMVGTEGFSDGDKFNAVNQLLGGSLDNTQAAFAAQAEQYAEHIATIKQLREADVLNAKEASAAIVAIKRQELESTLARTEQALGAAAGLMQSNNKEAFKVGQAAAIGQAIVNTYTAATAAYASAAAIPFVGWVLGPLAAAGAIAAGMAQVSAIRSQQMPAYRTGGSYTVGGHGGVDSQTVALRATPGEKISINTPAQARAMERMANMAERGGGGGRGDFTQNVTIVQQGKPDRKTAGQQARELRKLTRAEYERNT